MKIFKAFKNYYICVFIILSIALQLSNICKIPYMSWKVRTSYEVVLSCIKLLPSSNIVCWKKGTMSNSWDVQRVMTLIELFVLSWLNILDRKGATLVDNRAHGLYTLAGSPACRLVLNHLVAYTSTTVYICKPCVYWWKYTFYITQHKFLWI